MEVYQIVSLVISILAIPTLFGLIWKEVVEYKKKKREKNTQLEEEEKKREEKKMMLDIVTEAINPLKSQLSRIETKLSLVEESSQASLRNDLLKSYKECSDKGFRSSEETQNWFKMYQAYHNLGGNSFIDQTKVDFNQIPTEDQYEHENNKK